MQAVEFGVGVHLYYFELALGVVFVYTFQVSLKILSVLMVPHRDVMRLLHRDKRVLIHSHQRLHERLLAGERLGALSGASDKVEAKSSGA